MDAYDVVAVLARLAVGAWLLWRIDAPPGGGSRRPCTVVIPARDEQDVIGACVSALVDQLAPGDEVLVVDDHSTDATAARAVAAGATVVPAPDLPPGWMGKTWACATGAAHAGGDVLVFVDADTVLAPGALDALLRTREDLGGMVSACPFHTMERPYEHASAFFNVIGLMGTDGHSGPGRPRTPNGAYGPTIVVDAAEYRELGGHGSVRGRVVDDVQLAKAWRAAGRPVHLYGGRAVSTYRMYRSGLRSLVDGWTKNMAAGAGGTRPATLVLAVAWLSLPIEVALRALGQVLPLGVSTAPAVVGALYLAVAVQLWWMFRRVCSGSVATAALFPLPLFAFLAIFARSVLLTVGRRSVPWKGRLVPTVARRP